MADIEHADITDPYIHEPKGISQAPANSVYVANGGGSGSWQVLPEVDPAIISAPIGCVIPYTSTSGIPADWLACYGQAIDRTTYADLFAIIGTTYGVGDGSTTFNLPDMRGRAVGGWDLMGSVSANRLTTPINGDTIGAAGGAQAVVLTAANLPAFTGTTSSSGSHTHTITNGTFWRAGSGSRALTVSPSSPFDSKTITLSGTSGSHSHTVAANTGGGSSHTNVQPTIIMNYIMRVS